MTQRDQKGRLLTKENHTRSWGTYNCCTHEANEGEEVTGIEDGGGGGGGGTKKNKQKKQKNTREERKEKIVLMAVKVTWVPVSSTKTD